MISASGVTSVAYAHRSPCVRLPGANIFLGLSAEGFLRVMDSGSKGQAWFENLRHRFSTFCSEADEIICQDSVKYVRTQLITAGENLMHLCSELVEDVLHDISVDSAGQNGLASPTLEQDVNFPAQKVLSIGIDTDKDGKSCAVNSASTLLLIKPVGERCTDIQADGKVLTALLEADEPSNRFGKHTLDGDKCNVHAHSSTSAQTPAANSSEKTEESKNSFVEFQGYDDEVTCSSSVSTKAIQSNVCTRQFPITESDQSSCCQKLEESIIMVNSDECYMETNYRSLENTKVKLCTLKKKIASEHSFDSQGIYSETDRMTEKCCTEFPCAKDSRMVSEDFCDWEII
ncbi:uncharacterized protein [Primulina huaijiensis]|uniref:uncharacterized protein isoform X2 n=1 Tax=Primulina huaijiensis TaxID=1492673 RepID=UPI003CC798B1